MANAHASMRPARVGGPGPRGMMPGEKAKDFRGTVGRLVSLLRPHWVAMIVVFVFAIAGTLFSTVGPKVLSLATTELFEGSVAIAQGTGSINFSYIGFILVATLALYAVSAACQFVQSWLMTGISQKITYELRKRINVKIDAMPFAYFERASTGDVLSRITNDVDTLGQSLSQGLTQLVTSAVTMVGVLVMMLLISPVMTLVSLIIIPVSAGLLSLVVKKSQGYFVAQQNQLGAINSQVEETFSGYEVVHAFNQEKRVLASFDADNALLYESAWKSRFVSGLMMPIMNLVSNLGYVAVALLGAVLAVQRAITVGDVQAFIQYVKNFTQPIQQLSQVANVLQQMAASAERVFEFLDEEEQAEQASDDVHEISQGEIVFDHVRFGYDEQTPVIHDFSARVQPGQTVALVGPTGAGKTTMVKLLMRFYDVQAGRITLDGTDIATLPRDVLRNQFAMVLQETWLFNGTVRENIRYGRADATDEEVEAAARAALAHHFITTLPDGYDTIINEDASNLSAGQRQLLTIARAFLADRPMLILDEATSSVDTRTEAQIQAAMDNLMRGRTSFCIAHRLSTITGADLILVMDKGDIVEQGTHEELLNLGGFYANLYNSQFTEEAE